MKKTMLFSIMFLFIISSVSAVKYYNYTFEGDATGSLPSNFSCISADCDCTVETTIPLSGSKSLYCVPDGSVAGLETINFTDINGTNITIEYEFKLSANSWLGMRMRFKNFSTNQWGNTVELQEGSENLYFKDHTDGNTLIGSGISQSPINVATKYDFFNQINGTVLQGNVIGRTLTPVTATTSVNGNIVFFYYDGVGRNVWIDNIFITCWDCIGVVPPFSINVNLLDVDPENEGTLSQLNLSVTTTGHNVSAGGIAKVSYNDIIYVATQTLLETGVGGNVSWVVNVTTPFININNSLASFTWSWNITINASDVVGDNNVGNQNLLWIFPRVNISAISIISSLPISNFSGTVTKASTVNYVTTTGSSLVRLSGGTGNYELFIVAPGFAINNATNEKTFILNTTILTIYDTNFSLYTNNSISFNIFNASNNALVDTSTTVTLTGDTITYIEITSNGTLYLDNLNDDTYRTTIENANFDTTTIYLTLENSAHLDANIFLETSTVTRTFLARDTFGVAVPDATITFFKNINGTFVTAAQEITDFSGRATVNLITTIIYRMVAIAEGFDAFTGNVQPTEEEYTITLTATSITPFTSIYENLVWTTQYEENLDDKYVYSTFIINSNLGELEYFGSNTSYNGVPFFQNTTGSPGGGQINFNLTGLNISQTLIVYDYWFKLSGETIEFWNETYRINLLNVTDITLAEGLFDDLEALPNTNPIKGLIGAFIIVVLVIVLGSISKSVSFAAIGGIIGTGINLSFDLGLPNTLLVVSLIVCLVLLIVDNLEGGR